MFGHRVRIFKLFDFQIHVDMSWIFIALLVTWSLALGYFPGRYPGLSAAMYLAMGICGALGLFASIVLHELTHSLVARRFGLSIKGITLFVFGGVAEMEDEPPSAKAEFFMAVAGPLASIVIGSIFYMFFRLSRAYGISAPVTGVLGYLSWINWILAAFNLVPAFPLDGGRILRSALWQWKGDLRLATRISSQAGMAFGFTLSLIGVLFFFSGAFMAGLWYFLIGMFLQSAAHMSYQRILVLKVLEGESVKNFMRSEPVTIAASASVQSLVEDYIYKYHYKFFPVVENGRLIGSVSTQEVKEIPRDQWEKYTVGRISRPLDPTSAVSPEIKVSEALLIMNKTRKSRLLVVKNDKLLGIITLKDLLTFISIKMDLEGGAK